MRSVEIDWSSVASEEDFPFCLDFVRGLNTLRLNSAVTYIIGENGSGKSTLLEAIAVALGFNAEGGTKNFSHSTRASHSSLHRHLTLSKGRAPRDGFFFRAESYFNLATEIEWLDSIEEREELRNPPPKIIDSFGGKSLHEQSHGESFFALFMNRFGGDGIYILDEPEAALSPTRQMALLTRIHELVGQDSQFLIATHSPIVLAYPNATIYQLSADGIDAVSYRRCEPHVVMKEFLNNHEAMVRILLGEDSH